MTKYRNPADLMVVDLPEGESGNWKVERFTVSEEDAKFENMRSAFSGHGTHIQAGDYTRLTRNGAVVMSDTPDEKRDHIAPVNEAQRRGRENAGGVTCLVNGLGLGMVTVALLSLPNVAHVTVIEIAPEVIELVGTHLSRKHGSRLEIIEADAYTWKPPKGERWSVAWHDLWDSKCGDNLDDMAKLHRKYGRRVDWQGSWGKEELRYWRNRHRRAGLCW